MQTPLHHPYYAGGPPSRLELQSWIGPNLIFTVYLPFWVATGLQDTYLKLGLVIATGLAGAHALIGALFIFLGWRKVYPYLVELAMVILYPVLLGVVLGNARGASTVAADYNFIANAALAGVLIISMITCYPAGFQHVQEQVPWAHAGHEDVLFSGQVCTAVLALSHIASCLLYLIPFTRATINTHYDPLNLVFRLILPEVLTFLAVLFVRFWPPAYVAHLQGTDIPEWAAKTTLISYPPAAEMMRRPRVIDPSMMQPYPGVLVPGPKGLGVQPYSTSPAGGQQQPSMRNFTPQQQDPLSAYYHQQAAPSGGKGQQYRQGNNMIVPLPNQNPLMSFVPQQPSGFAPQQQQSQKAAGYGLHAELNQQQQPQVPVSYPQPTAGSYGLQQELQSQQYSARQDQQYGLIQDVHRANIPPSNLHGSQQYYGLQQEAMRAPPPPQFGLQQEVQHAEQQSYGLQRELLLPGGGGAPGGRARERMASDPHYSDGRIPPTGSLSTVLQPPLLPYHPPSSAPYRPMI